MEKENKRRPDRKSRSSGAEDVVYTEPKPFLRRRFVLHIATVVAVVVALILGLSLFFKVEQVTVGGMVKYSAWDVREASGISDGENLLGISKAEISHRIMDELPYVQTVRVGIKLPGTVHIEITEYPVTYAIEDTQNGWWKIGSDGRIVDSTTAAETMDMTKILGVRIVSPQLGAMAVAEEPEPQEDEEGNVIPVTIYGRERLNMALNLVSILEINGILGEMASVNVSDFSALTMWYGKRYEVLLGDSSRLEYKIEQMKSAIAQRSEYDTGVMDVRFTISPNNVIISDPKEK